LTFVLLVVVDTSVRQVKSKIVCQVRRRRPSFTEILVQKQERTGLGEKWGCKYHMACVRKHNVMCASDLIPSRITCMFRFGVEMTRVGTNNNTL
jgi:hypothetical protein